MPKYFPAKFGVEVRENQCSIGGGFSFSDRNVSAENFKLVEIALDSSLTEDIFRIDDEQGLLLKVGFKTGQGFTCKLPEMYPRHFKMNPIFFQKIITKISKSMEIGKCYHDTFRGKSTVGLVDGVIFLRTVNGKFRREIWVLLPCYNNKYQTHFLEKFCKNLWTEASLILGNQY
jgi:hypothetical protein